MAREACPGEGLAKAGRRPSTSGDARPKEDVDDAAKTAMPMGQHRGFGASSLPALHETYDAQPLVAEPSNPPPLTRLPCGHSRM
jgi:hypothetical protein